MTYQNSGDYDHRFDEPHHDPDPDTMMCSCGHYEAESRVLWHEGRSWCGKCDPLANKEAHSDLDAQRMDWLQKRKYFEVGIGFYKGRFEYEIRFREMGQLKRFYGFSLREAVDHAMADDPLMLKPITAMVRIPENP